MPTSGVYDFNPTVGEMIEEACERAAVEQTAARARSARRSMNLMFTDWATKGVHQWSVEQKQQVLTVDVDTYPIEPQAIDIIDMVLRRGGVEYPMYAIGRSQYLEIPDKTIKGRPYRYMVERNQDDVAVTVWQVPDTTGDIMVFHQLRRLQSVKTNQEQADIDALFFEAACAGLAERLALKFNIERHTKLKREALEAFIYARSENRERADTNIRVRRR
jgi:hypothetical protein